MVVGAPARVAVSCGTPNTSPAHSVQEGLEPCLQIRDFGSEYL